MEEWHILKTVVAAAVLILIGLTTWALMETSIGSANGTDDEPLDRDMLLMAAATIMAFAVFGSVLGAKIERNPENRDPAWHGRVFAPVTVLPLVAVQWGFMWLLVTDHDVYGTWIWGNSPAWWWVFGTSMCLVMVILFVTIGNTYPSGRKAGGAGIG